MYWFRQNSYSNSSIELYVEEYKIILNEKEFLYEEVISRNDIRCFSQIVFPLVPRGVQYTKDDVKYPIVSNFFDIYSFTYNSKMDLYTYSKTFDMTAVSISSCVRFIKYPETTNFKNGLLIVSNPTTSDFHPKVKCTVTTNNKNGTIINYIPNRIISEYPDKYDFTNEFLPKCTLSGDDESTMNGISLTFEYKDIQGIFKSVLCTGEIKTDKGYISHKKFKTDDGVFTFNFIPLGLNKGEVAKVQVGLGKYTDVVSKNITII